MYTEITPELVSGQSFLDFSGFFPFIPDSTYHFAAGLSLAAAGDLGPFSFEGKTARRSFFRSRRISPGKVHHCRQIHSQKILFARPWSRKGRRGDGLITRFKSLVVSVTAADCMPVFLFHGKSGKIALCHSGWKGTGIARLAAEMMEKHYKIPPDELTVLLGPCIGSCCYKVDPGRGEDFAAAWGEDTVIIREGGYFLDLRAANRKMLERAGVESILSVPVCTACNPALGSFRREGPDNYTRMTAFSGWIPAVPGQSPCWSRQHAPFDQIRI